MHIKLRVMIEKNMHMFVLFPGDLKKKDHERITIIYSA